MTQEGWCNPSSFSAEEYMETLQLRLDEDSTNGFFEAVFFLEDPVFWEVVVVVIPYAVCVGTYLSIHR